MADAATPALSPLAAARLAHATPDPRPRDLWRVRWDNYAGAALLLDVHEDHLEVAPVTLDDDADETARRASPDSTTLGFPLAVWMSDAQTVPVRVLDYRLGTVHVAPEHLPQGSASWGPTDPRERIRAQAQDLMDILTGARWAPAAFIRTLDLPAAAEQADPRALISLLGASRAQRLRDGVLRLERGEAKPLAKLLRLAPADLESATSPSLPDDLVAAMDKPAVRARVDQLAARRQTSEIAAWREAAQGALELAARQHSRQGVAWEGRINAYFDAALRITPSKDES